MKNNVIGKLILSLIYKTLIVIIIFISSLIFIKQNDKNKKLVKKVIYNNSLSFAKIYDLYNKYLKDVIPFKNIYKNNTKLVSTNKMSYNDVKKENNGYKFNLNDSMITSLTNGIVIKVSKNETYKKLITVQLRDETLITYGSLSDINVKLYDYIQKGEILGYSNNNTLYLLIKKNNKYISYDKYM